MSFIGTRILIGTRPFTLHMRKEEHEGKAKAFLVGHTPHSANETTEYMLVARNYDLDAMDIVDGPVIVKDKEIVAGPLINRWKTTSTSKT